MRVGMEQLQLWITSGAEVSCCDGVLMKLSLIFYVGGSDLLWIWFSSGEADVSDLSLLARL